MGRRFYVAIRSPRFRILVLFVLLVTGLAACVPRPSLHFSPVDDRALKDRVRETGSRPLAVLPFADDRTVASASGDPQLIGWGTGTGTLDTRQDIKGFVAKSFVREMERLGLPARFVPVSMTPFRAPKNRLSKVRNLLGGNDVVLLGSMREFQFQVNHPRYGVGGEFSLLDMQNAEIRVQVEFDLQFVDAGTGAVLWKGTLFSEEEKDVHVNKPGQGLKQATDLLSSNLRKVILQAVGKWSSRGF
jgi:hypothetical protein